MRSESIGARAETRAFCRSVLSDHELSQALQESRTWTMSPERAAVAARVAATAADAEAARMPLLMQQLQRRADALGVRLAATESAAAAAAAASDEKLAAKDATLASFRASQTTLQGQATSAASKEAAAVARMADAEEAAAEARQVASDRKFAEKTAATDQAILFAMDADKGQVHGMFERGDLGWSTYSWAKGGATAW